MNKETKLTKLDFKFNDLNEKIVVFRIFVFKN